MKFKKTKNILFVIISWFLFNHGALAQYCPEIDSLIIEVKEATFEDSIQLFNKGKKALTIISKSKFKDAISEVYLYYGNYFYYIRNVERANLFFEKAKLFASNTGNKHIETLAKIRLIYINNEFNEKAPLEQDLLNLLLETKQSKDYANYAEILNLLGIIKESKNDLQGAAELYLEGIVFSESHSIPHYPAVFKNNLGLIKLYAKQIDDALVDFEAGLKSANKENDKNLASHIQINICLIYVQKNRIKEALAIFENVINYARTNNHPRELSTAFINMSSAFNNSNNQDIAISYIDSAIVVLQKHNLNVELTKAYIVKTDVLITLKKNDEASKTIALAETLSEKTNNLEDKASCKYFRYLIDNADKKYQSALNNFLSYQKLKDSLQQKINGRLIQELQLKYNVQKKEVELEKEKSNSLLLGKKNQEERFLKWLSIGISLIVLILIVGIISYRYSVKTRESQAMFSRQLIQSVEQDRLRISMDLHDDIGQSLSIIKAKISHFKNDQDYAVLETDLSSVIEQTREISKNLYPSYLEKIGLVRSVARLTEGIQYSSKLECSFDISEKVEDLPLETKTHIYRILQECSNNTIKHAQASALKIEITEHNNEFHLIYQDNGIGLNSKQKNGLGLLSIKERAKIINGVVSFETKTNLSFKLTLKFNA